MRRHAQTALSILLFLAFCACAKPGIAPGDAQRGYIVWGFLGHNTTTAAAGQQATLYNQSGQPMQTVASDNMGKYVFAYHRPGNYVIAVGNLKLQVTVARSDQRLDIDLSKADGNMNYAAGAVENMGPPSCSGSAPAQPAAAGPGGPMGAPAQPAEQRDSNVAGSWSRTDTLSSGADSLSTKLSLLICADGSYTSTTGDSVGGGAGWGAESRGSDSIRGRWRTEASILYINTGAGWETYARYYVEGAKMMLTFESGQKEIWYR
jgi:hypothetical protein